MQKYSIFIGIDLSKKWFDATLCVEGHLKSMPHRRFWNKLKGFQELLEWVSAYAQKKQVEGRWFFCMEHTGVYAMAICAFFDRQDQSYALDNPLRIKRSLGLRRGKSDKADSRMIAIYAWRHQDELAGRRPLPNQLLIKIQALLSLRDRLVRYRHGLRVAEGELRQCLCPGISREVSIQTAVVVKSINERIKIIMKQIKRLIQSDAELTRLYDLLLSIIGIGPVIAPYLLVYTNGFTAFEKARPFACHIGIAAFDQQSGSSLQAPREVSRMANHKLKKLLSTAATVAIGHDPQIRAFFERQLKRGKEEGWIYNAVKNKIVQRIFAVVKRGTPYVKLAH